MTEQLVLQGETLDGFHIERIPQISNQSRFDARALSSGVGLRAVWRLYKGEKWHYLEDLGVDSTLAKAQVAGCCLSYGAVLTVKQLKQVKKKVPEFVRASQELRLAYALKFYERSEGKKTMKKEKAPQIFHAETTDAKAQEVAERNKSQIEAAGGTISFGKGFNNVPGVVMVQLPAEPPVLEKDILPHEGLTFRRIRGAVTVEIPQDALQEGPSE